MTEVDLAPEGPALFPEIDSAQWQETKREEVLADGDIPAHRFLTYQRISAK